MNRLLKTGLVWGMSLLLFTSAWAGQPLDAVKGPVEKILNILKDPQYEDTGAHAELRRKIWEITRPMFDFELIAKRVKDRPDVQRTDLMTSLAVGPGYT